MVHESNGVSNPVSLPSQIPWNVWFATLFMTLEPDTEIWVAIERVPQFHSIDVDRLN
jgi:hypothetical protein